jgi:hypothetical protein
LLRSKQTEVLVVYLQEFKVKHHKVTVIKLEIARPPPGKLAGKVEIKGFSGF